MASSAPPVTRYARAPDGVDLAYRIIGDGPVDLFWSFSQLSDVEAIWQYEPIASFLQDLASASRVVVHDRRGMGRSSGQRGDLAIDVADLLVLLDAVDARRPYLAGAVIGGAIYAAFAAAHPDRVGGLIWHGAFARSLRAPDYPWGATADELEAYATDLARDWGTDRFAADFVAGGAPSMAGDPDAARFFAQWMRQTGDAPTAAIYNEHWDAVDLRPLLPDVRVSTLITTRTGDSGEGAYVASLIPGATHIVLDGADFMPFFDRGPIVRAVRDFIDRTRGDGA